ncbi:hypothetical protein [Natrarchaeobius halalkaliphilus]|nr:hypothetical protein [Natrarchaeobius halalkaliphilus]
MAAGPVSRATTNYSSERSSTTQANPKAASNAVTQGMAQIEAD